MSSPRIASPLIVTKDRVMRTIQTDAEGLLTPAEVASIFRVDPRTVSHWAKTGKLTSLLTLGGHRRYRSTEVQDLLLQANPS
jgi:excisionase family DNA binding protein